jgi:hypothetical protein
MHRATSLALIALIATASIPATAQTVINLGGVTSTTATGETTLDLNNTSVALSTGGFRGGAVSLLGQVANNQLNVVDLLGTASGVPLASFSPLAGPVQVTMLTGALPTSLTTVNTSGAIASGINPIVGAAALNAPWTGGYGGASGGALVGGAQSGVNAVNGFSAAIAPGGTLSLTQQAGPIALLPLAQIAMLNSAITNTWFASSLNGGATINGAMGGPTLGTQGATLLLNSATVSGGTSIDVQQFGGAGISGLQAVNRAGVFTNPALAPTFNLR